MWRRVRVIATSIDSIHFWVNEGFYCTIWIEWSENWVQCLTEWLLSTPRRPSPVVLPERQRHRKDGLQTSTHGRQRTFRNGRHTRLGPEGSRAPTNQFRVSVLRLYRTLANIKHKGHFCGATGKILHELHHGWVWGCPNKGMADKRAFSLSLNVNPIFLFSLLLRWFHYLR